MYLCPSAAACSAGRRPESPEKTCPEQSRGQQLGIGQVPPVRGLRARKAQKIVDEAVHCYRLFCYGA